MADRTDLNWLVRRTVQEMGRELLRMLDGAAPEPRGPNAGQDDLRGELQRFQQSLEQLDESDLAIYGTALAGLEDTLMSAEPFHYRSVLDQLVQNIGGLLDDLSCFDLFGGDFPAVKLDVSWATTVRARVDLDVAIPLKHTRRRLRQSSLAPLFEGVVPVLTIQRFYRPRFLRAPDPDDWCYGLAGRERSTNDVTLVVTRWLPDTEMTGQAELPIIAQRTRLRDLIFGTLPPRQHVILRLRPADFVHILQGLLLDTREYCYLRAHDEEQRRQLNRLLFQILAKSGGRSGDASRIVSPVRE